MNAPSAPELFKALKGKGRAGDFMCACPAHRDRTPSLHVTEKQGAVLLKCHAGCPQEAVIDALRERHLWPEKSNGSSGYHRTSSRPPEQIEVVPPEDMGKPPILPEPTMGDGVEFKRREALASADVAHEFVYRQGGEPVFIKQRRKTGPKFLPFYRIADTGGELWQNKKPEGFKRLPYVAHGAPDPFQNAEKRLLWCEGERDVDSVAKLGFDAFTFGAAKDIPIGAEPYVRGRHVVIPADNDEAGMADAEAKVRYCRGHAASVTIVTFPELPKGGDVSDWIAVGHARDELRQRIIETPEPKEEPEAPKPEVNRLREIALRLPDFEGQPVPPRRWNALNRIPMCEVTGLGGDGGIGKTQIALQAAVRTGTSAPDWLGTVLDEVGPAIFFTAEEPSNEIHFRLDQIREHHELTWAEMANVHPVCAVDHPDIDPTLAGLVKLTGKIEATKTFGWLREMTLDIKPKLLCIEAASDVFDVDEIVRAHAKACVRLLQRLAIEADTAILLLFHPSLSGITSGRGTSGSTQWNNTMRSRLFFQTLPGAKDEDSDTKRKVLEVMKANRGPTGEKVILEWCKGVFVQPATTMTVERAAREQAVEHAFMSALKRLLGQNQDIHPGKTSTSSAAKAMKRAPETKDMRDSELFEAQQRLLDAGKIVIEPFGPPSKHAKRLIIP